VEFVDADSCVTSMELPPNSPNLARIEDGIAAMLGGRAAVLVIFGHPSSGAVDDLGKSTSLAARALQCGLARNSQCAPTARVASGGRFHPAACTGCSVRMETLDEAIKEALTERLLERSRLASLLSEFARGAVLDCLYDAVENGLLDQTADEFGSRVAKATQDKNIATVARERVLQRTVHLSEITPARVVAFGQVMKDGITNGQVPFRKAYLRLTIDKIEVGKT
jgi:site-specific DNA recombinase